MEEPSLKISNTSKANW